MSSLSMQRTGRGILVAGVVLGAFAAPITAGATLPAWLQHIVGGSTLESALYRAMQLPAVQALYPRPPKEAQRELAKLIAASPNQVELYALRARADEQALNADAAEADWKLYVAHAPDVVAAKLELAEFYQRRLLIPQEIVVLKEVAAAPPIPSEAYIDPTQQRSWLVFDHILGAIAQQGLPSAETAVVFNAFVARYPNQPAVYAAFLQFQLGEKDWPAAEALIQRYQQQFPKDAIFPIRARALLDSRRGNIDAALAVYDHAFQPLWPAELVQSYFALLDQTHRQRAFVAAARTDLVAHPDGPEALNALARIFFYDQQAGRLDSARLTLDAFRIARDARKEAWTPADLYTLAQLSSDIHAYSETARYNYALASIDGNAPSGEPAAQSGLAGLIQVLLEVPEQPLALGSQNLTLYRDIATLDQGPGYWNGILSLWLNGTNPAGEYQSETTKAQGYFHRSKAAELLAKLDTRFPRAPERARLHAQLIRALASYGEPATVVTAAKEFLTSFPEAPERTEVANDLADAYARQNDTADEFALYESQLAELGAKSAGLPLTASETAPTPDPASGSIEFYVRVQDPGSVDADAAPAQKLESQPLAELPTRDFLPDATAYSRVLDRYIGRLTATGQLPRALTVLRGQLDRNPNDPLLYERLATFLQQNNLSAQEERVFQQAISKFQQPKFYDKLARFYLRERKSEAFATLVRQVTDIFSGTDLDTFFAAVNPAKPIGPQLALQLNLYAAKRFPHDLIFTHNLLSAYDSKPTSDPAAYEALLRSRWWEADDLREAFLAYLSRTDKLDTELSQLEALNGPTTSSAGANPAALREQAEIDIFTSHFEKAAPLLGSVVDLYPADTDEGDEAISLYRSMAYLDPTPASTERAAALEKNLLVAYPDSPDRLATLGDLYAEATSAGGEDLVVAAPYWRQIPELHPGSTQGFLTSSTIFWDYFQFADALAQVNGARTRFHSPALFGFEAGAIEENRHDQAAAVDEYTHAVTRPIEIPRHFDSALGTIKAWLKPPSDAGDSNFRSTAQSFFGSEESNARLLQLATRPATKAVVDAATAKAVADDPANTAALTLRADVLAAQHHAPELTPLLTILFNQALDRTATFDEAAAVGNLAQGRNLTSVYERALAKQAELTLDPVQKIELLYSRARSLEDHNDIAGAGRIIDWVQAANPRILGVVRATTDFYVRTKQQPRAIATLLDAAKAATPSLARDFTLEAASHANDANDTAHARSLALGLLAQTPYDARVLEILATSYARAHDDAGLKQFYLSQLDAASKTPGLAPSDRKQDIALLRRGLIPALTRINDLAGGMDQYIALLSAFPDDSGLGQEAALYALKNGRQAQLLNFLRTTIRQSPRDSRFMILLAQAEATFGDLLAAESAYSLAINLRKDRVDLYSARVEIETRLSQTDSKQSELAAADFERLYLLSYRDPAWMIRLAELRARQQRAADSVKALEVATIDGHPKAAADYFTVAAQLEKWNLLAEARTFAEEGVGIAGSNLLTPPSVATYPAPESGAVTYARIVTRGGNADRALAALTAARKAAEVNATSLSVLATELARQNISEDEAVGFRQNFAKQRRELADQNLRAAVRAVGEAVHTYYTPEQKQAFALTLDKVYDPSQPTSNPELAIEAATAAGLTDREAEWRKQRLLTGDLPNKRADVGLYAALQRGRLQFSELGHTLEAYATRLRPGSRDPILTQAAQTFRKAGDTSGEMRIARGLVLRNRVALRARYFDLLLRHDPAAFTALALNGNANVADAVVNYTVAHGTEAQALAAVADRSRSLSEVWRPASASLVQTYFASSALKDVDTSNFKQALDYYATVGDRLGQPANPQQQLTGDKFFYYASRFGIFLATAPKAQGIPDAEDFLAAELEDAPTSSARYVHLAQTYGEAHNIDAASGEFVHALELSPSDPVIEDEFATALDGANRREDALTHWGNALSALSRMQQRGSYAESWFTSFEAINGHLGQRHLATNLRTEIESILAAYLAKNGNYRSNELLRSVYSAAATPGEGTGLILAVCHATSAEESILGDLNREAWLTTEAQEAILRRQIELARNHPAGEQDARTVRGYEDRLIDLYLSENQVAKAQAVFDSIPKSSDSTTGEGVIVATRNRRLQALLDKWRTNPALTPTLETLALAVVQLQRTTSAYKPDPAIVRPLLEFVFDTKDKSSALVPTDFLSLAQVRIDTGDLPGALDLLRRLTLQPASSSENAGGLPRWGGDDSDDTPGGGPDANQNHSSSDAANPYVNTDYAALLLEKNHRFAEAIPFLQALVPSAPWDAAYRLRLAQAQLAANARDPAQADFLAVARDTAAPYAVRVLAAKALSSFNAAPMNLGSGELSFLAHPSTPTTARQPYFDAARIAAAGDASTGAAGREVLLREAIAIAPNGATADRARVDLLLLQPATGDPSVTLAILHSMQSAPTSRADANSADADMADNDSPIQPEPRRSATLDLPDSISIMRVSLPAAAGDLEIHARIRLASQIASASQRDGNVESALAYAQLAIDLAKGMVSPELTRHRDELRTAVVLARRNALRRPTLRDEPAQSAQVRPRLTAFVPNGEGRP
ncbi:MAG: hypothetical protein M3Y72_18080 [Acidobacteriota bacterium]|nr:hypothetical protein [Acidobacteriota bacterium]